MYDVYEEINSILDDVIQIEKSRFISNKMYFELGA